MQSSFRFIPVLIAAAMLAHSQDEISPVSGEFETAPAPLTTARILGEIPDGTPPPPAPPKPEYHVAARDVLSTATHEQGGRTITIREIKPITLPPPPPPAEVIIAELDAEFSQRLAEYRENHPKNELLFLGATVFRSKDSPPAHAGPLVADGRKRDHHLLVFRRLCAHRRWHQFLRRHRW